MSILARMMLALGLAVTGQFAVMSTMLRAGADWFATFVTGILVFMIIINAVVFFGGRRR